MRRSSQAPLAWHCVAAVAAFAVFAAGCAIAPPQESDRGEHRERFQNPAGSPVRTSIVRRLPVLIAKFVEHTFASKTRDRSHILPRRVAAAGLAAAGGQNSITWIGHMTALLHIDGRYVLTDPWWSDYASPIARVGPRRYVPPALRLEELPPIDLVIVSHSHYDHLDVAAIRDLPQRERTTAVVPIGLGHYFSESGYGGVIELDWEQSAEVAGIRVTALPAIHWSKRGLFRTNDTLWASFALEGPSGVRVYFGGDSDHGPIHAELTRRWGGFDVALISIGGFHNAGVHCAPEDCVQIGLDLDARVIVPLHWGTIYLGEGRPAELPARFAAAAARSGLTPLDVWQMKIGETRVLPHPIDRTRALRSLTVDAR